MVPASFRMVAELMQELELRWILDHRKKWSRRGSPHQHLQRCSGQALPPRKTPLSGHHATLPWASPSAADLPNVPTPSFQIVHLLALAGFSCRSDPLCQPLDDRDDHLSKQESLWMRQATNSACCCHRSPSAQAVCCPCGQLVAPQDLCPLVPAAPLDPASGDRMALRCGPNALLDRHAHFAHQPSLHGRVDDLNPRRYSMHHLPGVHKLHQNAASIESLQCWPAPHRQVSASPVDS
mmetsp:Transcript_94810/g.168400  ORF Transcript_94810/g.168400 Transcript_94810/m.168400 type:complete len:237 (-) Transcript_94810:85-795(-)